MRDMIRVGAIVILVLISLVSIPSIINGSYGSNNSSSRNSTNNMVDLLYIWTVPSQIIVGDEFRIKAIVVNNSSSNHVITYKGLCE
ncbi:MAG: alpha-2-macroglobulin family protein, partial [Candidatus Nitrosocaldus sp.]